MGWGDLGGLCTCGGGAGATEVMHQHSPAQPPRCEKRLRRAGQAKFVAVNNAVAVVAIAWLVAHCRGIQVGCCHHVDCDPSRCHVTRMHVGAGSCVQVTGGWVLDGQKRWIGNGTWADVAIVWARSSVDGQVRMLAGFAETAADGHYTGCIGHWMHSPGYADTGVSQFGPAGRQAQR